MSQRIVQTGVDNYVIKVEDGGNIQFDVGATGNVTVTGDLAVQGETTSIGSSELVIEDNTITLNSGETGNGVTLGTSGIIIDRGVPQDAQFFFNESLNSITGGISKQGSWILQDAAGAIQGLYASSIRPDTSNANNLTLLGAGTSIVTVTGTTDYEKQVYPYTGSDIQFNPSTPNKLGTPTDDDALVTVRLLEDYVKGFTDYNFQTSIDAGTGTVTSVKTYDFEEDASTSRIEFTVDGTLVGTFFENRLDVGSLRLNAGTITTQDTNGDVILAGSGSGSVKFDTPGTFKKLTDPSAPTDGVTLYSKTLADGGTGLYFVNEDTTQDEIASRNKALLFSIIF
jgi:hypothetical protein